MVRKSVPQPGLFHRVPSTLALSKSLSQASSSRLSSITVVESANLFLLCLSVFSSPIGLFVFHRFDWPPDPNTGFSSIHSLVPRPPLVQPFLLLEWNGLLIVEHLTPLTPSYSNYWGFIPPAACVFTRIASPTNPRHYPYACSSSLQLFYKGSQQNYPLRIPGVFNWQYLCIGTMGYCRPAFAASAFPEVRPSCSSF